MPDRVYADKVIEFFDSGTGPIPGPYGTPTGKAFSGIEEVSPDVVLGEPPASPIIGRNPEVDWLALPTDSYVTVGFTNNEIIDGDGNDIFIRSLDPQDSAGESADVFVSSNEIDFEFLGRVTQNGVAELDLASIGFTEAVTAVQVVGVDNRGSSPGFDLVSVEALNSNPTDNEEVDGGVDFSLINSISTVEVSEFDISTGTLTLNSLLLELLEVESQSDLISAIVDASTTVEELEGAKFLILTD